MTDNPKQGEARMTAAVAEETFDSIREGWERILPRCPSDTVFAAPWWHKTWWDNFGGDGDRQPRILSVRDSERLLGIAPLMSDGGSLTFLGDRDLSDYFDFIVPEDAAERFYPALWERLAEMDWSLLDLPSLPSGSPTLAHLPRLAESAGMKVEIEENETTPKTHLPATWDDFLAGLRKKDRHELRRKLRRLDHESEHRQYAADMGDSLADSMGDFFRLLRASRDDKRAFMTEPRERFFTDIARAASERGVFRLYFLEVNGARVAGCICFDYGGDYLLYNSGYDPAYSKLSVGLINKALSLRSAIDDGRGVFNFLKGNERYKYNLGGRDESVFDMTIER